MFIYSPFVLLILGSFSGSFHFLLVLLSFGLVGIHSPALDPHFVAISTGLNDQVLLANGDHFTHNTANGDDLIANLQRRTHLLLFLLALFLGTDLSFSLEHGQSLGIIGPTGAGKSTLAQLLLRLYDIDSGQIRIDGRDISTFPLKELRQKFGVVFQNDVLFKDSLLNNIDMGRKLDMDAIDRAVEVAQAASFIAGSGGYEKPIAVKGVNLSGGQKQRVLIARALAGRPEFLILDDSSSALDYKTDAAFRRSLSQSFSGTTTIIIAQRISSIMHCDKILVLEDGIPQGLGTHEELLKTCDAYREISTIQMGGEDL